MTSHIRFSACVAAAAVAFSLAARAQAPAFYAIKGARIVTVAGAPIDAGTIVVRNGLIDAVGANVQTPDGAVVLDGAGLTVYPGLIDMGTTTGTDLAAAAAGGGRGQGPSDAPAVRTFDDAERAKREAVLKADVMAADHIRLDAPELERFASAGVTTVLETPPGLIFKGQSALVNVATPELEPIVGAIAEPRAGVSIVKSPVALHVEFQRAPGQGYPQALLGAIAFVRQSFIDAQYRHGLEQRYARSPAGMLRPPADPALDALEAALEGRIPVAFDGSQERQVLRALDMAKEFKLSPIITGGEEADLVAADLKSANAKVIVNANYPTRPRSLAPGADESLETLRFRAHAPKAAAGLAAAGVPFAFSSSGLSNEADFLKNVGRSVREGLDEDAALRALTIDAARIAGASDRVGSLEKGKIANLLVTAGDIFNEAMKIRYVFVDGRMVNLEAEAPPGRGGRGRGRGGR